MAVENKEDSVQDDQ